MKVPLMFKIMSLRFHMTGGNIFEIKMNDSTFFRYNNIMVIFQGPT
jgi:hypothetical protein